MGHVTDDYYLKRKNIYIVLCGWILKLVFINHNQESAIHSADKNLKVFFNQRGHVPQANEKRPDPNKTRRLNYLQQMSEF